MNNLFSDIVEPVYSPDKLITPIIEAPDYFSFQELIHTDTGLNNVPRYLSIVRTLALCSRVLNYIRHEVGFPISINSGFRSPDVNRAVGGVSTSHHLFGRAFDIRPTQNDKMRYRQLLRLLQSSPLCEYFDEVIPYHKKGFVHISIDMKHFYFQVRSLTEDKSTRLSILDLI